MGCYSGIDYKALISRYYKSNLYYYRHYYCSRLQLITYYFFCESRAVISLFIRNVTALNALNKEGTALATWCSHTHMVARAHTALLSVHAGL